MNTEQMMQFVTPDLDPRKNADHLFIYKGLHCRQTRRVFDSLDALTLAISNSRPKTIIEVGTFHGAFTQVLRDHDISLGVDIHTFDIHDFQQPRIMETTYHVGDIFGAQLQTFKDLVSQPGRCLVFCDGGNKELEVNTLCEFLKKDDIILCHDYAKTPAVMVPEIIGNWPPQQYESQWCNIKAKLIQHGFVPFLEDEMQRSLWGCFIAK